LCACSSLDGLLRRLNAVPAESVRLIMVKADGSVLVHADAGGYKTLNWMTNVGHSA
jgi:RecB family endonuclease NucS